MVILWNKRHIDSATQVYNKDLIISQGKQSDHVIHKDKKKGLFGSMMKGSKPKHEPETEPELERESFEELSILLRTFSVRLFAFRKSFSSSLNKLRIILHDSEKL